MEQLSKLLWIKANTISNQYKNTTSDFAKDKKKWWEQYKWIANKWYINEEAIWEYMCLDEKHVKNQFFTWLSNKNWKKLVAWIKWLNSTKIIRKLKRKLKKNIRDQVKEIAVDMSNCMEKIAAEVFTKAIIVTDRFHVRKLMNNLIWTVKNRTKLAISKTVEKEKEQVKKKKQKRKPKKYWPSEHEETLLEMVTRSHYQIRKNKKDRNTNQKRRRRIMKKLNCFKWIVAIYEMGIDLYEIYEDSELDKDSAIIKMEVRIKKVRRYKRIPELLHIANTIENRLDTITNYFVSRHTNWYVEWFHSRLSRMISNNRWFVDEDYMVYRFIKAFW